MSLLYLLPDIYFYLLSSLDLFQNLTVRVDMIISYLLHIYTNKTTTSYIYFARYKESELHSTLEGLFLYIIVISIKLDIKKSQFPIKKHEVL
jgi:hypothetical protein